MDIVFIIIWILRKILASTKYHTIALDSEKPYIGLNCQTVELPTESLDENV